MSKIQKLNLANMFLILIVATLWIIDDRIFGGVLFVLFIATYILFVLDVRKEDEHPD